MSKTFVNRYLWKFIYLHVYDVVVTKEQEQTSMHKTALVDVFELIQYHYGAWECIFPATNSI